MAHNLLVLHFDAQCPWQPWVVEQAQQAAQELGAVLHVVNVAKQPELAARYRLFFPFMTVVDEAIRVPSPTPAEELVRIAHSGLALPPAVPVPQGRAARAETVLPLNPNDIAHACRLCIRPEELRGCQAKSTWAASLTRQIPNGELGFVAYQGGQAVGVVEFLPASLVPYPLPDRSLDVAFITCLYSTEEGLDYRGQVLEFLLTYLRVTRYRELQVVAGQRTPYPNGPQAFFQQHGFKSVGEVDRVTLREGEETLVLLRRKLR